TTLVALLVNPTNPNAEILSKNLQAAATKLGLRLHVLHASTERDLDTAFAKLRELQAGGSRINDDLLVNTTTRAPCALAAHHAVPVISQGSTFALPAA